MTTTRRPRPGRRTASAPLRLRRRRPRRRRKVALAIVLATIVLLVAGIGAGSAVLAGSRCDLDNLKQTQIGQNTFVYAADSSLLGVIPAERNRQVVPLEEISPWLTKATVAIEDRRFYSHGGIDPVGILRALVADVSAGHDAATAPRTARP